MKFALLLFALAACPKHHEPAKTTEPAHARGDAGGRELLPASEAGVVVLVPALPAVPFGLPPAPAGVLDSVTPQAVALGELLFNDARLSASARVACASCHDPANRYNGVPEARRGSNHAPRDPKTPPQLENLAGNPRAIASLPAHVVAEMGQDLASASSVLAAVPGYQAHLARVGGSPEAAIKQALTGSVLTRYDANSRWDNQERGAATAQSSISNGYRLFVGKARCGTCHTPPMYTDSRDHDTGFGTPTQTRSLRGVAKRAELFSDGSAHSRDEALTHYTTDHPKTELVKLTLSAQERTDLLAFLDALTGVVPSPLLQPLP
ncbi:cytochrome c peroxidase [soil metagenome]